jgi:hypothetical protein
MLAGLKEGQEKMSKSDPDSAIFMEGAFAIAVVWCDVYIEPVFSRALCGNADQPM